MRNPVLPAFAFALALAATSVPAQAPTPGSAGSDAYGLPPPADVLDRIERFRTLTPEDAARWRRQLPPQNRTPAADLDLLLLDLFGPGPDLAPMEAQARMHEFLPRAQTNGRRDTLQLLQLVVDQLDQRQRLSEEIERLGAQLEAERHAHQETRDKLEAIRRIEREIEETRNGNHAADGGR